MELSAIMLQLEVREKELMKYVNKLFVTVITLLYYYPAPVLIVKLHWLSVYPNFCLLKSSNQIFKTIIMAWQNNWQKKFVFLEQYYIVFDSYHNQFSETLSTFQPFPDICFSLGMT